MLFHVTPDFYGPGDVKRPGAWGSVLQRALSTTGDLDRGNAMMMLAETTLEAVRVCLRPEAPSRLSCVYAWDNLDDAALFRTRCRPKCFIYAVEPASNDTPLHRNGFNVHFERDVAGNWIERLSADAIRYWLDAPSGLVEVLIGGPVRILDLVLADPW